MWQPGEMVPEFDKYCFDAATEFGVIGVVGSSFGTHLVRLRARDATGEPLSPVGIVLLPGGEASLESWTSAKGNRLGEAQYAGCRKNAEAWRAAAASYNYAAAAARHDAVASAGEIS